MCMCTRAVHLDLVTSLSSAAFISCFERFVATRGTCTHLYSDNGTSFVGAAKMMQEAFKNWTCPENVEILNRKGVTWTFMNPASPHQGGFYEAAVKSFKNHALWVHSATPTTTEFLSNRNSDVDVITGISTMSNIQRNEQQAQNKPTPQRPGGEQTGASSARSARKKPKMSPTAICPLCKENHTLRLCPKFDALAPDQREVRMIRLQLCRNCFSPTHATNMCLDGNCKVCRRKHNSMLHHR